MDRRFGGVAALTAVSISSLDSHVHLLGTDELAALQSPISRAASGLARLAVAGKLRPSRMR